MTRNPKGASPYGCLDMAGNAWEWVASPSKSDPGPGDCDCIGFRVAR